LLGHLAQSQEANQSTSPGAVDLLCVKIFNDMQLEKKKRNLVNRSEKEFSS